MQKGRKIIVPQVLWHSISGKSKIDVSEFSVEVDGYFKKDIVVTLANGNSIRVTSKNKILISGGEAGTVKEPILVYDTGIIIAAEMNSEILQLKLVRNFPKYSARRIYYEVLLGGIKAGYLIFATHANTKIVIRIFDEYIMHTWFFGYSAMKVRMSFDS